MGKMTGKMLHDIECCEVEEIHEDKVQMVSEQMPPEVPASGSCLLFLRRISVSAILRLLWG